MLSVRAFQVGVFLAVAASAILATATAQDRFRFVFENTAPAASFPGRSPNLFWIAPHLAAGAFPGDALVMPGSPDSSFRGVQLSRNADGCGGYTGEVAVGEPLAQWELHMGIILIEKSNVVSSSRQH